MNDVQPAFNPAIASFIAYGLIAVFILIGLRYTYRAFLFRFVFNKPFNDPKLQAASETMPQHRSMTKALAAYALAAIMVWLFFYGWS